MLRQAVPYAIQRDADKVINIAAIEEYLKPEPHDDDNATTIDVASPNSSSARQAHLGQPNAVKLNSGQFKSEQPITKQNNPYALGKRLAREEMARRAAEHKRQLFIAAQHFS